MYREPSNIYNYCKGTNFRGGFIFVIFVCYISFCHLHMRNSIMRLMTKMPLFKYFSPVDPLSSSNSFMITTITEVNSKVLNNKERGQKRGEYLKLSEEGKAIVGK